jgi:mRNA interferase MazF
MVIHRGEVWWANLPVPEASEPGYRHPVLIVQSNEFNESLISTVVVAVITSNLHLSQAPGNVLLPKRTSRLPKDSVINVSQLVTIDKSCLSHRTARLPEDIVGEVEDGIRLVLAL